MDAIVVVLTGGIFAMLCMFYMEYSKNERLRRKKEKKKRTIKRKQKIKSLISEYVDDNTVYYEYHGEYDKSIKHILNDEEVESLEEAIYAHICHRDKYIWDRIDYDFIEEKMNILRHYTI